MSSIAMSAPMRISWPCRAHGPDSGAIIATLISLVTASAGLNPSPIAPASASPEPNSRRVGPIAIYCFSLSYRVYDPVRPSPAEIGLDDAAAADDVVGPPGGDQASMVENTELVDEPHHRLHRMFDDQYRHPLVADLADDAEDAGQIVVTEPRQGL